MAQPTQIQKQGTLAPNLVDQPSLLKSGKTPIKPQTVIETVNKKQLSTVANKISSEQVQDLKNKPTISKQGFIENLGVIKDQAKSLEIGSLKEVNALVLHRTASDRYQKPSGTIGAHFFIDKAGDIFQTASLNKYAQHVGKIKSKCWKNTSCSNSDSQILKNLGWKPKEIHKHELHKDYPERYPNNKDSIGIEVVGNYSELTKTWEPLTKQQVGSLNKLVDALEVTYKLKSSDRYNHEDISYKTAGEGATVENTVID